MLRGMDQERMSRGQIDWGAIYQGIGGREVRI